MPTAISHGENPAVYPTLGKAWLGRRKGQSAVGDGSIQLVLTLFQDLQMDLETLSGQQRGSGLQALGSALITR